MKCRRVSSYACFVPLLFFVGSRALAGPEDVSLAEIMYNPRGGEVLEYIELHHAGTGDVDLGGWRIAGGIEFRVPAGVTLGPDARLVIARDRSALLDAYADLDPDLVVGDFTGALSNGGDVLILTDAAGDIRATVIYDDDAPWDEFADGLGPSLELVCPDADPSAAESWHAGRVPVPPDARGGTPSREPEFEAACPAVPRPLPSVHISEIHYHAVLEESYEDRREFIEIHNSGTEPVALAGWRITGGIDFTFAAETTIAPGAYLVVARDREALLEVEGYELSPDLVIGEYGRTLDNGGEVVALVDAEGYGVEMVTYDDDFPWPSAADGLGVGESWLPREVLPLEQYRYRGRSLERVSFAARSSRVSSWDVSSLESGPTPGHANSAARDEPNPIVVDLDVVGPAGDGAPIRAGEDGTVRVSFEPRPPAGPVRLEWFVDDVAATDEPIASVDLLDDGRAGDEIAGDGVFTASVAGQPENSIVRYRVVTGDGEGSTSVSPRPSDPFAWHAWFVEPLIETTTRTYHLFISPVEWGRLWSNIQGGRVRGCAESPTWDAKVPAVFVHEGRVYDVQVRYQGSRWNRTNGRDISRWTGPRPSTGPLRALSWRIAFPRYAQLEGRGVTILNKLTQGCPGYNAGVGYRLFARAGVPAPFTRFVRFHINGNYYHYMMEYERPDDDMMRRYHREEAAENSGASEEPLGHLFKSAGCNCDEGPFGWGDERPLRPQCGHTAEARYAATYDRKTHEWDSYTNLKDMIEGLDAARRAGTEETRRFFEENFDMELLLNYLAIINWSVPFDDMFQNHFLYQRRSDGKWLLAPWDLDQNFGEWKGATASIYMGEIGDRDNRSGWFNYLKDAFIKAFRDEFRDHLLFMNNTLLHPDRIDELVDLVTAASNPTEAAQSAAGVNCSFPGRANSFKAFARQRFDYVNRLAGAEVIAGEDQVVFAGETVVFDASASSPDPSDSVTYEWDNGMVGERATAVFDEPGEYVVTLTVTMRGIPFEDQVNVKVLPVPSLVSVEKDGQVIIEGEDAFSIDPNGEEDAAWVVASDLPGASGGSYLEAKEINRRRSFLTRYAGLAPEARYAILFTNPGTYRVWIRGIAPTSRGDSLHVNLRSVPRDSDYAVEFIVSEAGEWYWNTQTRDTGPLAVEVTEPGLSFLTLWMRESSLIVDKLVLTTDENFVPAGDGPPASPLEPPGKGDERAFIRGDVDGNGKLQIQDPVAILFGLFRGGASIACEDRADVDDDGALELTDAVLLLDYLFRRGSAPAAPFPARGFDTTADPWRCGDAP